MQIGSGSALLKGIAVAVVAVMLLIPLALLNGLVSERTQLREQAVQSVAQGWGGRQMVAGPLLAIPVSQTDDKNRTVTRDWYLLPDSTDVTVDLAVQKEPRRLGIYEVPVYVARLHAKAQFDVAREVARLTAGDSSLQVHLDRARLLVPVSDPRGLRDIKIMENQVAYVGLEPVRGFPTAALAAPLRRGMAPELDKREIDLSLEIAGTESLNFLPLSHATRVQMSGNWPHPGFTSGFLPVERHIEAGGFKARWQVLDLNRSYGGRWLEGDTPLSELQQSAFGVDLVQPVDFYQQVTRSVKYGGLFIGLSFLTLFLVEFLLGRPMHPIQYGLMGLALSVFYLLLLALSEHIGFGPAYLLAALALCALLAVYISGALRSRAAGVTSGGVFAAVYGLLYLLVTAEDYALLAGALALFALVATLMVLTRKLDWYGTTPR